MRDLYSTHTGTGVALSLFTAPASAPYRHGIVHYHHYQLALETGVISLNMAGSKGMGTSWIWDFFNKDKEDPTIAVCAVCKTYKWLRSKNSSTACKFFSFILYFF